MTRMVQLADDAYESLSRAKQAGESFSQTVRRLTRPRASLLDLASDPLPAEVLASRDAYLTTVDSLDRADLENQLGRA